MLQQLLVFLAVSAAAIFAAWRLMGARARVRLLEVLARCAGNWAPLQRLAQRQRAAFVVSGCAACSRNKH